MQRFPITFQHHTRADAERAVIPALTQVVHAELLPHAIHVQLRLPLCADLHLLVQMGHIHTYAVARAMSYLDVMGLVYKQQVLQKHVQLLTALPVEVQQLTTPAQTLTAQLVDHTRADVQRVIATIIIYAV